MVRVDTDNFSNEKLGKKRLSEIEYYANNAIIVAPAEIKTKLQKEWDTYIESFNDYINGFLEEISNRGLKKSELEDKNVKLANMLNERIEKRDNIKRILDELYLKEEKALPKKFVSGYYFLLTGLLVILCWLFISSSFDLNHIMMWVFIYVLLITIIYSVIISVLCIYRNNIHTEITQKTNEHDKLAKEISVLLSKKSQISDAISDYDESINNMKKYIDKGN